MIQGVLLSAIFYIKRISSFSFFFFLICCSSPQKEEKEITAFYDTVRPGDLRLDKREDNFFYPKPDGWVSDFENVFSNEEKNILDSLINNHKTLTTNEIAIVTVPASYYPEDSLDAYSLKLFNRWGIGDKEKMNGVGIIFCLQNRKLRIETGKGLMQKLTNEKSKKIIDSLMLPSFKNAHYFDGVMKGVAEIISIISKGD